MNMNNIFSKEAKEAREEGWFQSVKKKVMTILSNRKDVTRSMLPGLCNSNMEAVSAALTSLRKSGINIYPPKGPGTPLKIASTAREQNEYLMWRRRLYLPTAKRMVTNEARMAEEFPQLADRPVELLKTLNEAKNVDTL